VAFIVEEKPQNEAQKKMGTRQWGRVSDDDDARGNCTQRNESLFLSYISKAFCHFGSLCLVYEDMIQEESIRGHLARARLGDVHDATRGKVRARQFPGEKAFVWRAKCKKGAKI